MKIKYSHESVDGSIKHSVFSLDDQWVGTIIEIFVDSFYAYKVSKTIINGELYTAPERISKRFRNLEDAINSLE